MWVQLRTIQYIDEHGRQVTRYPGDWVNVGKQLAQLWLSRGDAIVPSGDGYKELAVSKGAGALYRSDDPGAFELARAALGQFASDLEVTVGNIGLPYKRTMLWSHGFKLRRELVPIGLSLLETWEIAVPLFDYKVLAANVGSEAERERTKAVVRDLRIPLYDTRLMFVRKCDPTVLLFERWQAEREHGDERLAFLRALYATPLLVLALPVTWTDPNAY